jgi:uncharacterized membrane protein (DUF373 family)
VSYGWSWITAGLGVFALSQIFNAFKMIDVQVVLESVFLILLIIGLFVHLMKVTEKYPVRTPQRV